MSELLGGTTGQVLSKTSNTNMDFTWVTPQVGDITAVTAGTGITGGGTSGAVTVSFDQANFGGGQYAAGKNKIINGDFSIFQRSTSATMAADATYYAPDRWKSYFTAGSTTVTWSRQTFTPGAAPVAGYEGQYFSRISAPSSFGATGEFGMYQPIENVQSFAGQQITVSFYAKADSARTSTIFISQNFGSGGSSPVSTLTTQALTTSWTRYSLTVTLASISGKTIGTNSALNVGLLYTAGNATGAPVMDVWGFQVEAGSTATPFQTATGTVQGELAACQRYYQRANYVDGATIMSGQAFTATLCGGAAVAFPVQMRALPISSVSGVTHFKAVNAAGSTFYTSSAVSLASNLNSVAFSLLTVATGLVAGNATTIFSNNANCYIEMSSEL
jgi:LysM repeat protein